MKTSNPIIFKGKKKEYEEQVINSEGLGSKNCENKTLEENAMKMVEAPEKMQKHGMEKI